MDHKKAILIFPNWIYPLNVNESDLEAEWVFPLSVCVCVCECVLYFINSTFDTYCFYSLVNNVAEQKSGLKA